MASASLSFKHLAQSLPSHPLLNYDFKTIERLATVYWRGLDRWVLSLGGLLGLWLLSWQLVTSVATGIGVVVLAYWLQHHKHTSRLNWHRLWHRPHRAAIMALVSGAIASCNTYIAAAIWSGGNPGLALGMVAQELGLLALLMVWINQPQPSVKPSSTDFYQLLMHLTDADPLKRLITVRRATDWVMQRALDVKTAGSAVSFQSAEMARHHLADCLRLMLSQEPEPTVRSAVMDSLQLLNPGQSVRKQLGQGAQPLPLSAPIKQPVTKRTSNKEHKLLTD